MVSMLKLALHGFLVACFLLLALAGCADQTSVDLPPTTTPAESIVSPTAMMATTATPASPTAAAATATLAPVPAAPIAPTPTAPATAAPVAAPTEAAETAVTLLITGDTVNLRGGPGTAYPVVGQAGRGQRFPALGRNAAGDWWQIAADGRAAWVSAGLASVEGHTAALPVIATAEPTAQPAMPVQVYETQITIPTYPYAAFTSEAVDPVTGWSYRRFDREAYEASNPQPAPQAYRAVVLENEYLRITLLPELGGRIYQVIFKPTGSNELYQNPVLKPSPWGPAEQGGWLAAGGIEWGLPVPEHGYAWGDRWGHITNVTGPDEAAVTVFMTDERNPRADVDVILRAGEAAFTIQPRIVNTGGQDVTYQFWLDAMLAPGPANQPGPNLRLLLPADQVTVHSRGDDYLPVPGQSMSWPVYNGVDYSRLGNWNRWLGIFERPAAAGPFAGVYDEDADEGIVRVFAPGAAPGSKIFAPGWGAPFDASDYTDGASGYVELHAGVTPTFWDEATLAGGATQTWQETWFPVAGIGGVSYADGNGALSVRQQGDGLAVGLFPVRAVAGRIEISADGRVIFDEPVAISPDRPYLRTAPGAAAGQRINVRLFDQSGVPVINYERP